MPFAQSAVWEGRDIPSSDSAQKLAGAPPCPCPGEGTAPQLPGGSPLPPPDGETCDFAAFHAAGCLMDTPASAQAKASACTRYPYMV